MDIDQYCEKEKISFAQFAKMLNISTNYLLRIRTKKQNAGKSLAMHIQLITGGKVKISDLRDETRYQKCPLCGRKKRLRK